MPIWSLIDKVSMGSLDEVNTRMGDHPRYCASLSKDGLSPDVPLWLMSYDAYRPQNNSGWGVCYHVYVIGHIKEHMWTMNWSHAPKAMVGILHKVDWTVYSPGMILERVAPSQLVA